MARTLIQCFYDIPLDPEIESVLIRLGIRKNAPIAADFFRMLEEGIKQAKILSHPTGLYLPLKIFHRTSDSVVLENETHFQSTSLSRLLQNSEEAVLMAATIGPEIVDAIMNEVTQKDAALGLILDAAASQTTDAVLDWMMEYLNSILVCYQGLFSLEDSIRKGKPEGLNVFGNWPTVDEALSHLPPKVQESWFKFDHYYSDQAFGNVLPHVFKLKPRKILDIGGNTGKFAFQCLGYSKDVAVSIMDLSGQLTMAKKNAINAGFDKRMSFIAANVLNESQLIPTGYDIIWMSQFLDCFSDEQIISILRRCRKAIDANSRVCILEPFWDRQQFRASAFSLMMISLYFTTIANGNSPNVPFQSF